MPLLALLSAALLAIPAPVPEAEQPPVRYQQWISHLSQFWYSPDEDATPDQRRGQLIYRGVLVREIGRCTFTIYVPRATRRTPTQMLRWTLSPLRRAASPADLPRPGMRALVRGLYVEWVRRVVTADGRELLLAPAVDREQSTLPPSCMRRIHARLQRSLTGEPEAVRHAALQAHRARRAEHPPRLGPRIETVSLLGARAPGDRLQTLVSAELPQLLSGDVFSAVQTADPARTLVAGLVTDGVERVTLTLGRQRWDRGALGPEPPPLQLTLPVHDNVVAAEVERVWSDAAVLRSVLHHAAGYEHPEIRVIR